MIAQTGVLRREHPRTWRLGLLAVAAGLLGGASLYGGALLRDTLLPVRIVGVQVTPRTVRQGEEATLSWEALRADAVEVCLPDRPAFTLRGSVGACRFQAERGGAITLTAFRLRPREGRLMRTDVQRGAARLRVLAPSATLVRVVELTASSRQWATLPRSAAPPLLAPSGSRQPHDAREPARRPSTSPRLQESPLRSASAVPKLSLDPARRLVHLAARGRLLPLRPAAGLQPDQEGQNLQSPVRSEPGPRREPAHVAVEDEAAPLMLHALEVYYRLHFRRDPAPLRELRRRGWRVADLATLCLAAGRSGRSLEELTSGIAQRRDGTPLSLPNATPAPGDVQEFLRLAIRNYYALPTEAVAELEARGWTIGDILVAGNLERRSHTGFWTIATWRDSGQEWSAIADRLGIAPSAIGQIAQRP
jgi:hypothetical protein